MFKKFFPKLAAVGLLACACSAQAAYTLYIYPSGANVVASGSGAINTAGINVFGNTGNFIPDVRPNVARVLIGAGATTQWQGISGPTSFGPGNASFPSSNSGSATGIVGINGSLRLPPDYVSGTALQGTSTWTGSTLASLGMIVGTYTYTWGAGATADSYTIVIGAAPPQTITFAQPGPQVIGTTPTLTATASSGLPVSFTTATSAICTITTAGVLTPLTPGTCTINANQDGGGVFPPAPQVARSFAVSAPVPVAATSIPTLSEWALIFMASLVGMFAMLRIRKSR